MADEEAEQDRCAQSGTADTILALQERLQELAVALKDSTDAPDQSSSQYCQEFCQTLVEYASRWKVEEDPLPVVEVYTVALVSYAQASSCLSSQCENVPLVLERLTLSCVELLLSLSQELPEALWTELKTSIQAAHATLQQSSLPQLGLLASLAQGPGLWTGSTLHALLHNQAPPADQVAEFLTLEGAVLLEMRVKRLVKQSQLEEAARLASACADHPPFQGEGLFKQLRLVCLCAISEQDTWMEEVSKVDCRDALEMICNLEAEGDDRAALSLCSAFLTRQLLQGDSYCAWELTLFWSKLLKRLADSQQAFLDRCRQMSLLSKTVFHILFLIKVIQSEMDSVGLPVCIEMCIRAIQMEQSDGNSKATICKTISCLLPGDLEVKRACQLTEFLLEPTVDAYYAVETLYNEPDQKLEEENLPVPNSLRCELLLVFKTLWPFDPEFWDWKALKRQCLALMGEEASIVSSIDLLNDNENPEEDGDGAKGQEDFRDLDDCFMDATNELKEIMDKRQKNREVKKLREKGFISARFRNWQAYMQYCVLCDKEFLGHRIVRHAQTHYKDGVYHCPICAETFNSKETLVPHVASHVKLSCKERLAAMKTTKKLANPKTAAPVIAALKAKAENQLCKKENGDWQDQNGDLPYTLQVQASEYKMENVAENTCPVANCKKGFKFLKNLLVHVKAHGDNDEAKRFLDMQSKKVVCQYCRRQFVSVTHLNDHLQVHCGVKPYICIQLNCKASFLSNTELIVHRKEHFVFKARCMFPSCGKIFNEAYKLYDHEAQHYNTFTCKVPDCGKVLRSQAQLDAHQEEHVTQAEDQVTPTEDHITSAGDHVTPTGGQITPAEDHVTPTGAQVTPGEDHLTPAEPQVTAADDLLHSLVERMLYDGSPLPQDCCQENFLMESLLESHAPIQNSEQYAVKSEPPDKSLYPSQQASFSNHSVIRSIMNAHMSDPNQLSHTESSGAPAFDYMRPAPQYIPLPPYQSSTSLNMQHVLQTDVLQNQATFPQDVSDGCGTYGADLGVSLPEHHQDMRVVNALAPSSTPHYTPSAVSQTLPPALSSLPPTGNTMTQLPCPSTTPATAEKQRHNCAFETCTRDYSSYRSVTKHMKANHPEFYAQWKLSKQNNRVAKAPSLVMPLAVNTVPPLQQQQVNGMAPPGPLRQNVIQSHTHLSMAPNPSLPSCSALPSQSHTLSNQMESVLDPILSQLVNTPDQFAPAQSNMGLSPPWHPTPGHNSTQTSCPPQGYPSNLQGIPLPQMDASGETVSHGPSSSCMLGSNMGPVVKSLPARKGLQPIRPSCLQSVQGSSVSDQATGPATAHMSSSSLITAQSEKETQIRKKTQLTPVQKDGVIINSGNNAEKGVKRNRRTKWPAIKKDGKYICSRCFREFQSPKSLGGHLSKRSHCKVFDETELVSDLPSSFLDLLNSEQSLDPTAQPPPSGLYNPSAEYSQEQPSQSLTRHPPDSKCLPNVSYSQDNLSAYGIGEQNDDILKQIMDSSGIPDLFENLASPQPPFHSPCGPYGGNERAPTSSVIQHTGNIKVKTEPESYSDPYLQSCEPLFSGSDLSDPLLSQLLSERILNAPANSLSLDHVNNLTRTDTIAEIKEEKRNSDGFGLGGQANDRNLTVFSLAPNLPSNRMTQMMSPAPQCSPTTGTEPAETQRKTVEQDVKRKLREQILAGDFQRRQSLTHSTSTETNASSNNTPLTNPTASFVQRSGTPQNHQSSKKVEASNMGLVNDQEIHPTPLDQILETPNPQSFVNFREPSSEHCDAPVPAIILENDVDFGPQSSANQYWVTEIQAALEQLDLDRRVCENPQPYLPIKHESNETPQPHLPMEHESNETPQPHLPMKHGSNENPQPCLPMKHHNNENPQQCSPMKHNTNENPQPCLPMEQTKTKLPHGNQSTGSNISVENVPQVSDGFVKPFACEGDGCTYRAMTKDAVLKHLMKAHNYTDEMIASMKKNEPKKKFSPFCCQLCSKTFTRNSNLRAHCQSAHKLSAEEVAKLNPRRNSSGIVVSQDQPSAVAAPVVSAPSVIHTNDPRPVTQNIPQQYSVPDGVQIKQERTPQPFKHSGERIPNPIQQQAPVPTVFGYQMNAQNSGMTPQHLGPGPGMTPQHLAPGPGMASQHQAPGPGMASQHQAPGPGMASQHQAPGPGMASQHQAPGPGMASQHLSTGPGTARWSNGQYLPVSAATPQYVPSQQAGVPLPTRTTSMSHDALRPTLSPSLPNKHKMLNPKIEKPVVEAAKKMKEKKPESNDALSPYRPYRCVHHGCVAAFTIQHNLIQHYRLHHQSAVSTFEESNENDPSEEQDEAEEPEESSSLEEPECQVSQVTEFWCQVRDCSRVFQEIPSLLQHYLQLHKFTLDKAGSLMSSINLGRFRCDQPGCATYFTAFWKYIGHVKEVHEKARAKVEPVDGMFRCDVPGCDLAYATRSNLLRHTMKKHPDIYKLQLMNIPLQKSEERVKPLKTSNGKENIETNKKNALKVCDKKNVDDKKKVDKSKSNHWTKFGNPSLKSKEEAVALCIKKYTLQYPCMIKGCDTVMNSERNIMKHYMGHGLSEQYLQKQRSHFIFCKKSSRRRYRSIRSDDSKTENSSDITASEETDTGPEGSEYEYTKPVLRKRGTTAVSEPFDSKPSSSESISDGSVAIKRKRGRQRKSHLDKMAKRKRVSRPTRGDHRSDSSSSAALTQDDSSSSAVLIQDDQNNISPTGFEISFLKFLEQTTDQSKDSLKRKVQQKAAKVLCKKSKDSCVKFMNPQQLKSLRNVNIVVNGAYSNVADLLLKQLQEMRPTVILQK